MDDQVSTTINEWPCTTDASVWAKEFIDTLHTSAQANAFDFGFMVGWFANAIEAGRTAGLAQNSSFPTSTSTPQDNNQ